MHAPDFCRGWRAASQVYLADFYCVSFFPSTHSCSLTFMSGNSDSLILCNIPLPIYLLPCVLVFPRLECFHSMDILEPNCSWPAYWIGISLSQMQQQRLGPGRSSFYHRIINGSTWVSALGQNWSVRRATLHTSQGVIKCVLLQPAKEMSALPTPGLIFFFFFS